LELTADKTGAKATDIVITTSGTNQGVERITIWNGSTSTFDPGTTLRRSEKSLDPTTPTPSEITLTGLGQDIPTSTTYLFVVVDLTSDAAGDVQPSLENSPDLTLDNGEIANTSSEFPLPLSSNPSPLPVELTTFEANTKQGGALLMWRTASETNNAGFHIERRSAVDTAGAEWKTIGFKEGAGTTTESQQYRFTDSDLPYEAESVSYRLKQIDTDGSASFSDTRTLKIGAPDRLTLHAPFPNPAQGQVTLRYALPRKADVSIRIYDVMGREVTTFRRAGEGAGRKEIQVSTADLSSGTYFVRMQAGEKMKTKRLTVVK
jgi:hypothetical protein